MFTTLLVHSPTLVNPSHLVQNVNSRDTQLFQIFLRGAVFVQQWLINWWAGPRRDLPTNLLVVFDEMLYLPALTTTLPNNQFVIAVFTLRNFQAPLCFSVLDWSVLERKHNTHNETHFFSSKQIRFIFQKCNMYLFKIPQHVELLLLGRFALVQSRVDSAGIHQAAVAVVLVRFDSADVELSVSAIKTVLHTEEQ